jgi:carboxypeptidase Taq
MLSQLAHERAVEPALGTLIDALADYGESLPYDSDDASLIRVARREYQKKIKVPPNHVARATANASASYDAWTRARPANDFETMVPYLERTWTLAGNIPPTLHPMSRSLIPTSTTRAAKKF